MSSQVLEPILLLSSLGLPGVCRQDETRAPATCPHRACSETVGRALQVFARSYPVGGFFSLPFSVWLMFCCIPEIVGFQCF